MKRIIQALVAGALISSAMSAFADPCGVELCLTDYNAAKDTSECKEYMDEFFAIIEKKHGAFSPSRTLAKRRNFLYQCESGNDAEKEAILATFGTVYKPSY